MTQLNRRAFFAVTAGAGAALTFDTRWASLLADAIPKGRLLHAIDCTQELPADRYFALGDVKVVDSPLGRYREAPPVPGCRFGYRFAVENVGRPHVAIIRFPDDKRRYMCINDGTCYDLTTGVTTDWAQPISGSMIELRQVFWPRWRDCSIVFQTWGEGEPAAVASFEIHELDELPALQTPGDPGNGTRREFGIQYEDPTGFGAAEGAANHAEWIERIVQYGRHTGRNLLIYPMAWYHGPVFPSEREPSGDLNLIVAADRKQYVRWTTHPADWYPTLLERFAKEGMQFQGALTLMRLGSLLEKMNINLDAIRAGADTYNNMMWNNGVQSSTNDWTPIYNARNFNTLAKENAQKAPLEPWSQSPSQFAYGETLNPGHHTGPMFNPLHPTVQEAILGFTGEIGRRYAKYPAFVGISFNMFAAAMPWYGSIHAGYDDYSIALFEKETQNTVPVDSKAADRFAKRYEFLTSNLRAEWIDWRCRKIRELFGRIRQSLAESRPDLRVTVTLWDETLLPAIGHSFVDLQTTSRKSMREWCREAGIDIDLYRDEPGLEIDRGMGNSRDRGGNGPEVTKGVNLSLESSTPYRDFDFLDQESLDAFAKHDRPGAFVFNCWVEAWGEPAWFRAEDGDPNVEAFRSMDGVPAEDIIRWNSRYPDDGFWWDSQLRITPPFPAGVHFLEPFAHAVAAFDACRITRGGLFLDKAHSEALRQFAAAYRALPRRRFNAVGQKSDPVVVRDLVDDGRRYFYAVNRDYYPVEVTIDFDSVPNGAEDLATGRELDLPRSWTFALGPYELRSLAMAPGTQISGFTAVAPETIRRDLLAEADGALDVLGRVCASGNALPGMAEMMENIRIARTEERLAWLRRALSGYLVRKARTLPS